MALCDQTVPNTFGYVWAANVGSAPLPPAAGFGGLGDYQLYFKMGASPPTQTEVGAAVATCAVPGNTSANQVTHGFLLDFADPAITGQAQADAAAYLKTGTNPSQSLVVLP
jgi:hypothetical protein